jgi:hypothetical protein
MINLFEAISNKDKEYLGIGALKILKVLNDVHHLTYKELKEQFGFLNEIYPYYFYDLLEYLLGFNLVERRRDKKGLLNFRITGIGKVYLEIYST